GGVTMLGRDVGRRRGLGALACFSRTLVAAMLIGAVATSALMPPRATAQNVAGDVDCNGVAEPADLAALETALFLREHSCATADVNSDRVVTAADLVALIEILAEP